LADAEHGHGTAWPSGRFEEQSSSVGTGLASGSQLGNPQGAGSPERKRERDTAQPRSERASFWADCDWLPCRDGKARPVEPGTFPLAQRVPGRVGRLRGYGNAIVPQVAAEVVRAYMDV
jgi:DNA (cytosine-5)-methyltransferase 1